MPNLQPYVFEDCGAGQNHTVKNATATASNTYNSAYVATDFWFDSNFQGAEFKLLPGEHPYQLGNGLYNEDASMSWQYVPTGCGRCT